MASDARLLKASLRGDNDAFSAIVRRYQSLVCAITYSGTGDLAASEDLAQEVFLAAWRKLGSLREPARLRSWLCAITRNLTADYLRRRPRDPMRDAVPLDEAAPLRSPAPAPAEHAITEEQERLVWAAVHDIPETYRLPLILYYREQHSVRRVARALALSRAAVKQRLTRGRGMLKGKLASLVEDTLSTTGPGSTFAAAVLTGLAGTATQKATGVGSTILGLSLAKAAVVGALAASVAVGGGLALRHLAAVPKPKPVHAAAIAGTEERQARPEAEAPAVVYADLLPEGLVRFGCVDFARFTSGARQLKAKTGLEVTDGSLDEAVNVMFGPIGPGVVDLARPMCYAGVDAAQEHNDIAVLGLADPAACVEALSNGFEQVEGRGGLYVKGPEPGRTFTGVVDDWAVSGNVGQARVEHVMQIVRQGKFPREFPFPGDDCVLVWPWEPIIQRWSQTSGRNEFPLIRERLGIVRDGQVIPGHPLAPLVDATEAVLFEGLRTVALSLSFREDNLLAKWQLQPVAGTPLEALLAGYPHGELGLLGHLPADSIVALACKLPDLGALVPAAGGRPAPVPARVLALLGDEVAFAFGRSPTGSGLLHLAARVRDPAACGQLMNQLAAMAAGLLANPQANGALPLRLERSATPHNRVTIHVWDFELTDPLPNRRVMAFLGSELKLYEWVHGDVLHLVFGDSAFEHVKQIVDGTLDDVAGSADFAQAADDMPDHAVMAGLFRFEKLGHFMAGVEGTAGPPFPEGPPFVLGAQVIGDGVLEVPIKVPHPAVAAFNALQDQPLAGGPPAPPLPELHQAARDGNLQELERLLAEGADVDAEDSKRRTPLHVAAEWGRIEVVRLLLEAGAEPNAVDVIGVTPTGLAVGKGHTEVADMLGDHGGVE